MSNDTTTDDSDKQSTDNLPPHADHETLVDGVELDSVSEPIYPDELSELEPGEVINAFYKRWMDGHGTYMLHAKLVVIDEDIESDATVAIPIDSDVESPKAFYKISEDMSTVIPCEVMDMPEYHSDTGEYVVQKEVRQVSSPMEIAELRTGDYHRQFGYICRGSKLTD